MKFEEKVREIFGGLEEYKEDSENKTVFFVIDGDEFTAEDLFKLSDLLGTGTIRVRSATRNGGYCETCWFEYSVMELTAIGVDV